MDCEVLIVGAGPTGLVLALWLTKLGVKLRIIDKTAEPGTTSRALAIHARTIELYRQLDLADSVAAKGHKVPAVNLWIKGAPKARIAFDKAGEGLTPYPFLHIFPQDEHERLLIAKLEDRGVRVERNTTLTGYEEREKSVLARLRGRDGVVQDCEVTYIAGCDGARSTVRATMGAGFPGGTYEHLFYVADIEASGPPVDGELHVDLDEADFLAVFPLADRERVRLVGSVRAAAAAHSSGLQFSDVNVRAIDHLKVRIDRINWFSTYHVHHRVASRFRKGRAFVLGDAGHIHSPAGGQGMNTGIGDAINLAWKLKWVLAGLAPDSLLDSYESERMPFARRLVNTTDRAFSLATKEGTLADFTRTRIAPFVLPPLFRLAMFRDFAFRAVSQISISYRHCSLTRARLASSRAATACPGSPEISTTITSSSTEPAGRFTLLARPTPVCCNGAKRAKHPFDSFPGDRNSKRQGWRPTRPFCCARIHMSPWRRLVVPSKIWNAILPSATFSPPNWRVSARATRGRPSLKIL